MVPHMTHDSVDAKRLNNLLRPFVTYEMVWYWSGDLGTSYQDFTKTLFTLTK